MTADETQSVKVVKNHGCFWPTEVFRKQKGHSPPRENLSKYGPKGSKKWIEGCWMYGPLDTLVPGAINLIGEHSQNIKKTAQLTEDPPPATLLLPLPTNQITLIGSILCRLLVGLMF